MAKRSSLFFGLALIGAITVAHAGDPAQDVRNFARIHATVRSGLLIFSSPLEK